MMLRDLFVLTIFNLRTRRWRTAMNLFGVSLGGVVLLMTFAGTRGVAESFDQIFESSPEARLFRIQQHYWSEDEPPESVVAIEGKLAPERRKRLRDRLVQDWKHKFARRTQLDEEAIQEIRALPLVKEVMPVTYHFCKINLSDQSRNSEKPQGSALGIPYDESLLQDRLLCGQLLDPDDEDGVLLSEYAAFEMGYIDDDELEQLIGQQIDLSYIVKGQSATLLLNHLARISNDQIELTQAAKSVSKLMNDLDATSLSESEKSLFRNLLKSTSTPQEDPPVVRRQYHIRGIVRLKNSGESVFSMVRRVDIDDRADVYLPYPESTEIALAGDAFQTFDSAVGIVGSVKHLEQVTEEIESQGFRVESAWQMIKRVQWDIEKVRQTVVGLSLVILLLTSISIFSTMARSVLERTSEFGIMKAVGAKDRQIFMLIVCEGGLTGLMGGLVAVAIAYVLSGVVAFVVRGYISQNMNLSFTLNVFSFHITDICFVVGVTMIVSALAGLIPARRAARLDPVVAMRTE